MLDDELLLDELLDDELELLLDEDDDELDELLLDELELPATITAARR